ncbi:G-protein coupled receptor [Branchiostoma belcheri]|nr:G-protein coupled receptor [Branchiostoma belcheri]
MEFNASNATLFPSVAEETFLDALDCYHWYVKRNFTYHEANDRCFVYGSPFGGATVYRACMGIVGSFVLLFNSIVLWGILGTKQLRKALFYYIANLACADLATGVACLYFAARPETPSLWERLGTRTLAAYATLLSTSALTLLSVDRYISVLHPVVYHNKVTGRQAGVVILASWVVITLTSFSSHMGWNCLEEKYAFSGRCSSYLTLDFYVFVIVMLLLLVSVMLWANIRVYREVKRLQNRKPAGPRGPVATGPTPGPSNRPDNPTQLATEPKPGPSNRPDNPTPLATESRPGPSNRPDNPTQLATESRPGPPNRLDNPTTLATGPKPGPSNKPDKPTPLAMESRPGPPNRLDNPTTLATGQSPGPSDRPDNPTQLSTLPRPGPSNLPDNPTPLTTGSRPGPSNRPDIPTQLATGPKPGPSNQPDNPAPLAMGSRLGPDIPTQLATSPRPGQSNRPDNPTPLATSPRPGPSSRPDKPTPKPHSQDKIKKVKAVMTVVFVAFVSWLLFFAFLAAHRICEAYRSSCPVRGFGQWGLLLAFLNSLVNPLVHGLRVPALRGAVRAKFNAIREAVVTAWRRGRVDSAKQRRRQPPKKDDTVSTISQRTPQQQVASHVDVSLDISTESCEEQGRVQQGAVGGQRASRPTERTLAWK